MRHATRPAPASYGLAGAICAIGVASIVARVINRYTSFVIHEPFDSLTFALAAVCAIGGPVYVGILATRGLRQQVRELLAEVDQLRAEKRQHDELLEAIRSADAQGEVNTVLLRKLIKAQEEQRYIDQDTVPILRLHSINGGA